MSESLPPTPVEPFVDEDTEGAASFSRAVTTARDLSGLPQPPRARPVVPSQTTPESLKLGRVGLLFALIAGVGLAWWITNRFLP